MVAHGHVEPSLNKPIKIKVLQDEHNERLNKDKATSRFKNAYGESEDWKRFQWNIPG